ncbi:hypothetical protein HDU83_002118 [Entophlyctis luteolus]|nr:hypothetical protein HDU83_002118 [Entophlyctis luteolus]KAJ3383144.1 hypothetical protein HDU84_003805 [Entophlyctis sp. JEL0112]
MKVLIIGAGLVGTSLALSLAKQGHECVLYELNAAENALDGEPVDFGHVGGSVLIQSNGLRILELLGVLREAIQVGNPIDMIEFRRMDGSAPLAFMATSTGPKNIRRPLLILRRNLHHILLTKCLQLGVTIYTGKKLVGLCQQQDAVTATFADGTNDCGDILIGADGMHSSVRRLEFGDDLKAKFTGVVGFIGVTNIKDVQIGGDSPLDVGAIAIFTDRVAKKQITLAQAGNGNTTIDIVTFMQPDKNLSDWRQYDPNEREKELDRLANEAVSWGFPESLSTYINRANQLTPYAVYDLPNVEKLVKDRVLLIGDAAHGMSPSIGQGLSIGLEDVGVLHEAFSAFPDPSEYAMVFRVYEKARLSRVHTLQDTCRSVMAKNYSLAPADGKSGSTKVAIGLSNLLLGNEFGSYDYLSDVSKIIEE